VERRWGTMSSGGGGDDEGKDECFEE